MNSVKGWFKDNWPALVWITVLAGLIMFFAMAGNAQTLEIMGHSEARTMYQFLQNNPGQVPFQSGQIHAINHDSSVCSTLLLLLPYDIQQIDTMGLTPTAFVVWIGDVDAENNVPVGALTSCVQSYVAMLHGAFPGASILFPTVPADTYAAEGNNPTYLPLQEGYNAALPGVLSGLSFIVPVDVSTLTTEPDGYGNPELTYIDFLPDGWRVVMFNFRKAFQELHI